MISLFLHIVFASAFTLLLKWAQLRGRENVIVVGAINYIAAGLLVLPVFLFYNPQPAEFAALWTGGGMGTIYFIAFFFVIYAIKQVGASATTVVSVLSIAMPILFAAVVFEEVPATHQVFGIVLAMVSLTLISGNRSPNTTSQTIESSTAIAGLVESPSVEGTPVESPADLTLRPPAWIIPTVLISFFFLCGLNRLFQDAFKHYEVPAHRPAFLLAAFTMSGVASLVLLIGRRKMPTGTEFLIGIAIGLSNLLQTFFILRALQRLEGFVVFPLASGGAILFTTLIAVTLLGERLNRKTQIGISLSIVALCLLFM